MRACDAPALANGETRPTIVARAPTRIDLAGGWTDVPPYADERGGCVCNVAITRYATVAIGGPVSRDASPLVAAARRAAARLGRRSDAPVTLTSDFPVGAGLGGSSAAGVALAAAFAVAGGGPAPTTDAARNAVAEASRATEVDELGVAGGRQDHYAAAFGGALRLDFGPDAGGAPARATRLAFAPAAREGFERRAVLVYTGESRISSTTITAVLDAYGAREPRVVAALARMRQIATEIAAALERAALDEVGALLAEHWVHQRALHPRITTPRIDALIDRATRAGALGAKPLGASGGGCVVLLAGDGQERAVRDAVGELGNVLAFRVDDAGVTVTRRSS